MAESYGNAYGNNLKPGYPNGTSQLDDVKVQIEQKYGGPWLKRRTTLEKVLFLLLLLAVSVAIVMIVVVVMRSPGGEGSPISQGIDSSTPTSKRIRAENQSVCISSECVQTAARILESINPEVDPCDNFFEYACGSWNRKNIIPDDRSSYNTFVKLADDLFYNLRGLLEEPEDPSEPVATKKAKRLYASCMNMSAINTRGADPLFDFIKDMGGWPVLGNWNESHYDLEVLVAKLRLLSNKVLLQMWVTADDRNSSMNIIQLDQSSLGLPARDYFLKGQNDRQLQAYQTYATNVAIQLGATEETAKAEMDEMVKFEIQLANITVPSDQRRDMEKLYWKMAVRELYTNVSDGFDWLRYLNLLFDNVTMAITSEEPVVVYAADYLRNMVDLVKNTEPRVVVNYAMWRIVFHRVANLHKPFLDLRQEFNKALHGTEFDRARWRVCVSYTNNNFGMAVGRLFVQKHFDESAKSKALEMISNIRTSFNELLKEVSWMDNHTRAVAKEKADAIQEKIGYPEYIMNNTQLDKDYLQLDMDPLMYFENVLRILNDDAKESIRNLRKPVDKTKWSTTPAVVNAFYSATKNQIMFPAGILQPPFYHAHYPKSMNFGGIAMVIGHEITHGFDDRGRQFDKDGNLKQWWSTNVIEKFKATAQCIIDQYGNYTVPEVQMNLNGRQTQGENIADNGGLKQAYRAYRSYIDRERNGKEENPLPGLTLTHDQLFFINFAQIWCGTARPENYIQTIRSGRHSPGRFRVIGSVSNSKDFARAFNCPAGSKMNPTEKCSVW